jgi:hypothetical protein
MPNSKSDYASYLLRLRCVSTGDRRAWTASLQSTATSAEQRFTDINALVGFLQSEYGECEPVIDTGRSPERSEGMP